MGIKRIPWLIILILFTAFILRIWGINHGFPDVNRYFYETEEFPSLQIAMGFGTGDLNPHSFNKPTLYYYLLFFCYGIFYLAASLFGFFNSVVDFLKFYFYHTSYFYLVGRLLSVIFGVGSVYMLYLTAKKQFNTKCAFIAAILLAVIPLHVEFSQAALSDMLGLFLGMVSVYYALLFLTNPGLKNAALSSFFAGLAMSAKYYYGFFILAFFLAVLLAPKVKNSYIRGQRNPEQSEGKTAPLRVRMNNWAALVFRSQKPRRLIARGASFSGVFKNFSFGAFFFIIAFILGTPFAILDWRYFISSLSELEKAKATTTVLASVNIPAHNWWIEHILALAKNNVLGVGVLIISIFGIVYSAIKHQARHIILLSLVIFFYIFFSLPRWQWSDVGYLLPIVPYLVILGSYFLTELSLRFKARQNLLAVLLTVILVPPFFSVCLRDNLNSHRDTKYLAKQWIQNHIPAGSVILMDKFYVPQLTLTESALKRLTDTRLSNQNKLLPSYRAIESKNKYAYLRDESLTMTGIPYEIYLVDALAPPSVGEKESGGIEFIILNSTAKDVYLNVYPFNFNRERMAEFYNAVRKHGTLVKIFMPNQLDLPGPEIEIYKVK